MECWANFKSIAYTIMVIESWVKCMYKPSYMHTCINTSVSVHTRSVIRTKVTDLVCEKKK